MASTFKTTESDKVKIKGVPDTASTTPDTKGDHLSLLGKNWSFSKEPLFQRVRMDLGL
jgi:hypothetical protein